MITSLDAPLTLVSQAATQSEGVAQQLRDQIGYLEKEQSDLGKTNSWTPRKRSESEPDAVQLLGSVYTKVAKLCGIEVRLTTWS